MFEKKVIINDDFLIVGRNQIPWDQIIGLKEQNSPLLKKISYRFPRAEILLTGGKIITICNIDKFLNQSSSPLEYDNNIFEAVIMLIQKKAPDLDPNFKSQVQWRLILPIAIIEVMAFIISIIMGKTLEDIVLIIIFAGILSVPIGWLWEKQKRKTSKVDSQHPDSSSKL